jgi:hypothetical protein
MDEPADVFESLNREIRAYKDLMERILVSEASAEILQLAMINGQLAVLTKQIQVVIFLLSEDVKFSRDTVNKKGMN